MLEQDGEQYKGYLRWYQRPAFAAAIALVLLFSSTLVGSYLLAKNAAENEALKQAKIWSNSASMLVAPLILSKDLVSLNFVTNQIADDPFVAGIQITDSQTMRLAAAGKQEGVHTAKSIAPNNEAIAQLEVWIDPTPVQQQLNYQTGLISSGAIIAFLLSLFIYRRQSKLLEEEVAYIEQIEQHFDDQITDSTEAQETIDDSDEEVYEDDVEAEALIEQEPELDDQEQDTEINSLDNHLGSEAEKEIESTIETEVDTEVDYDDIGNFGSAYDDPIVENSTSDEPSEPNFEEVHEPNTDEADIPPWEPSENETMVETNEPTNIEPPIVKMQIDETDKDEIDLVELLKPERREPSVPPFKPLSKEPEQEREEPSFETLMFDTTPERQEPVKKLARKLPIINEEQLDLYTIEQELDLLTPASEAAYVVLIDFTSPHSALISNEEQLQIKRTYRTLANSVANIYEGEVSALGEDILIQFDNASEDDEHGVNAACAAMLFAQLARSYNRSRSDQQEPILNVHTAIVRGQQGRQDRMADEARFLTRSTKTDRLISHTALSEAPDLKSGVLSTAEIKREDEDKVLILSLSKSYQDLLEKQGRYLLAKLAQQAAQ
ncbi:MULTISPECIES: hypothetical protein [unclassified Marinobacterium]|uniref:hypothetical protein n=1 Tax=unclassified Marinobacterium TaxID=2644139 RepID=UPI001569F61D|nr:MULTISPECIES: hypothetical protein [unclassified Marinobacterium]NRP10993.1 hypothetical protein [Marinobacterium sp. xm-g-48]NRP15914.1 hypothetical protein [Marinobacterium sp. xm-a-152]NRP28652.1 hypothetical protein [Marinobacterium sp. xm-d-420]NRP47724.1 hypothetical protein [Marinobacterium sp. xm-d-543]NRP83207.1 hypothetical protein [Marinobacterium sp. xm-d-509]